MSSSRPRSISTPRRVVAVAAILLATACLIAGWIVPTTVVVQWMAWAPRALVIAAALAGVAASMGRWRLVGTSILAVSLVQSWSTTAAWRPVPSLDGAISIMHVNARHPGRMAADWARALTGLDADVIVVTECGRLAGTGLDEAWRSEGRSVIQRGNAMVASRLACDVARSLGVGSGVQATWFRLQLAPVGTMDLVAVDLPSSASECRTPALESLHQALALEGANPDVIVGDFNTTPIAPQRVLLPDGVEAFSVAGSGCGSTFPREWPLVRIDQTLVGAAWQPIRAETFDPGLGAHRGQLVWIRLMDRAAARTR